MAYKDELLADLRPKEKPNVIELVEAAGLDVSDWSKFKGGPKKASVNPKYCYEWCFEKNGIYVFNIWYEHIEIENDELIIKHNYRSRQSDLSGTRLGRSRRFDSTMQKAFENNSNARLIILDRPIREEGTATARGLDPVSWTISNYDRETGDFRLVRGDRVQPDQTTPDPFLEGYQEGEPRRRYVIHRNRESRLRKQKILQSMRDNGGHLVCEVPGCGFDFQEKYGVLGNGFAEVHHLNPLSQVSAEGVRNNLNDLAVVCSNCHAMIHRGGECRDMAELISR